MELKLEFMTPDQIERIHSSNLGILEEVDVLAQENDFLNFLARNGVNVDLDDERAKMPPSLIKECTKKTPKHVTLYAREPKRNIPLEEGRIFTHPVGGAANVLDADSGDMRLSTLKDVKDPPKIVDYLPNIHTQTMIVYPSNVPIDQ